MVRKASLLAIAISMTSMPAYAQTAPAAVDEASESGAGLSDIVVTARRRAENLQDVPVAVSAVGGDTLTTRGVFQTSDLPAIIPNLQISSAYGTQAPNFSLRGISLANEYSATAASPVGIYVDDVYQTFRASHGQQLFDLERVEVLRGPQGTLYGRNTTGGAVNFITQRPKLDGISGYVTAGYGNLDRLSFQGAIDATLVPDELGIRIAGSYVKTDPYMTNLIGRDPGGSKEYGIRGTLLWKWDGGEMVLKGYHSRAKGASETNAIVTNPSPDGKGPITFGPLGAAFGLLYDRSNLDSRTVEQDGVGDALTRTEGVVLKVSTELSDTLVITSLTGYDSGRYSQAQECDGTPVDICAPTFAGEFKAFNQELRLNYETDRLKAVGGVYYGWDRINVNTRMNYFGVLNSIAAGIGLPPTYFNPGGLLDPTAFPTALIGRLTFGQRRTSYAGFGEVVYELSDRFSLTAGARYTRDSLAYIDGLSSLEDATGATRLYVVSASPTPVLAGNPVTPLNLRAKSSAFTGRVIASYKPSDDVMLYASYSRGYRAGAVNGNAYQNVSQVYFVPPEKLNSYEGGIKSRFLDDRLQINAAAFYNDYNGQQVQELAPDTTSFLRSLNGSIKGAELEVVFKPVPPLLLSLSGGYLDSKYDSGQVLSGINIGGNKFPFAPNWTLNAGFDLDIVESSSGKLTLHADTAYMGKYYYDMFEDDQATGLFRKGGGKYWLVNSRVTYEAESWKIAFWGRNLTKSTYYPFALNIESSFGLDEFIAAPPRTYGVEVGFKF